MPIVQKIYQIQKKAEERFSLLPPPSLKDENFRFTNLQGINFNLTSEKISKLSPLPEELVELSQGEEALFIHRSGSSVITRKTPKGVSYYFEDFFSKCQMDNALPHPSMRTADGEFDHFFPFSKP